jgi:hypothetical protein
MSIFMMMRYFLKKIIPIEKFILDVLFVAIFFNGLFCDVAYAGSRDESVSIINLIATPERYHGKVVVISAYVTIKLGYMSLCPTEHPLTLKDCLWLEIYSGTLKTSEGMARYTVEENKWRPFDGRAVSLRGTFDKKETGRRGMWSGAIKNVTAFSETEPYF